MTKRCLVFRARDEWFEVNQRCQIRRPSSKSLGPHYYKFSKDWLLVGVAKSNFARRPTETCKELLKAPEKMNGKYVFDRDHGTYRRWRGGGSPRASNAHLDKCE